MIWDLPQQASKRQYVQDLHNLLQHVQVLFLVSPNEVNQPTTAACTSPAMACFVEIPWTAWTYPPGQGEEWERIRPVVEASRRHAVQSDGQAQDLSSLIELDASSCDE